MHLKIAILLLKALHRGTPRSSINISNQKPTRPGLQLEIVSSEVRRLVN